MPPPSDERSLNNLRPSTGHVIVCGLGDLGEAVVRALAGLGSSVIGVGQEPQGEDELFVRLTTIDGDPTSEAVLQRAHIESAGALISTVEGDASNALICVNSRGLNPRIRLVVRGETAQSVRVLESLGADVVVCPEIETGRLLARAVLEAMGRDRGDLESR